MLYWILPPLVLSLAPPRVAPLLPLPLSALFDFIRVSCGMADDDCHCPETKPIYVYIYIYIYMYIHTYIHIL